MNLFLHLFLRYKKRNVFKMVGVQHARSSDSEECEHNFKLLLEIVYECTYSLVPCPAIKTQGAQKMV